MVELLEVWLPSGRRVHGYLSFVASDHQAPSINGVSLEMANKLLAIMKMRGMSRRTKS